jgi:formylglycine-generating enzyme required for sulfatase activity
MVAQPKPVKTTTVPLPLLGGLTLLLLCVTANFCVAQNPPGLQIQIVGGNRKLTVTGDAGSFCQVQYSSNLTASFWTSLTNLTFYSNSATAIDPASSPAPARFYRTVATIPANFAWVPSGVFVMGSPTNESLRISNSETQHNVTLTKGLYMGQFLVTQGSYLSLMHTNPSYFNTNHGYSLDLTRPVEQVSWADATNYCAQYTAQEQAAGRLPPNFIYRLPTESEWEYACRAGTTTPFYYGNNLSNSMANFDGEYEYVGGVGTVFNSSGVFLNRTTSVGGYQANAWRLYDMAGNLWEWCQDWYGTLSAASLIDPQGPASGSERVFRGGTFNATGALCRSANRNKTNPAIGANTIGFRFVLALTP